MRMRDRLRLPRVLRKRKRRRRKRMRRRRRRSRFGQIVRQEEPPIHLRNCSLPQLHKTTAVDSCYSPKTNFTSKSWDFSVEIYKCFKFMFMGYSSSRQQTNYFPLVRFDFTQSPYLMGCFPKLNKDGNSA